MTDVSRPLPGSAIAGVLADLVRRGLLRAGVAHDPQLVLPTLAGQETRLAQAAFVTACGLRNLPVLNRIHGAAAGDLAVEALRAAASAVALECDPGAVVVRTHGPDVLVLHGSREAEAVDALARRLSAVLAAVALPAAGVVVHLHPFVATLEAPAAWRGSVEELVRMLDELRLVATPADERPVRLSGAQTEATVARMRERDERLARVSEALEHGAVEVHFQPVVNLRSGRLEDVEALARIRTPAGLLTASEFIDDLHSLGETALLDIQVLRRVGEGARLLAGATGRLFLNVSPLSLGSPAFREQMSATLARLRAEGLRVVLVLELTEQALIEHHDVIREIHELHGVSFAVDDFGTGYSSLRTVADLAVSRVISILKIDGSLTRRITESAETYKVVLAIAHLARSLDLRVVAEHVENEQTLARLRTTGIECGQGFLFDPPLAPEELIARHGRGGVVYAEPPPRPQLSLLVPYLHSAFEGFYEALLSDAHFARFFRDEAQVRALVEKQKEVFVLSLDEEEPALALRYARLGRIHAALGIPLATFLRGADILHEQLLDVLVHATGGGQVLRDTVRFFAGLRGAMALGYLELRLPEARREIAGLEDWLVRATGAPGRPGGGRLGCGVEALDRLCATLGGAPPADEAPAPVGAERCPAGPWLEQEGCGDLHRRVHADIESLDHFASRADYAAAFSLLEGLVGGCQRIAVALVGPVAR